MEMHELTDARGQVRRYPVRDVCSTCEARPGTVHTVRTFEGGAVLKCRCGEEFVTLDGQR
jgi:hypothetical protein